MPNPPVTLPTPPLITSIQAQEIESVLALLVTHRGVFFVHNLVTAVQARVRQRQFWSQSRMQDIDTVM